MEILKISSFLEIKIISSIYVTSFSSISYYRNSRLISKTDLVRDLQSIGNQKSMFHLKLSPPFLAFSIKYTSSHFQRIDQVFTDNSEYLALGLRRFLLNNSIFEIFYVEGYIVAHKFLYLT